MGVRRLLPVLETAVTPLFLARRAEKSGVHFFIVAVPMLPATVTWTTLLASDLVTIHPRRKPEVRLGIR